MIPAEFWTMVRFMLYPVMLVMGIGAGVLFLRRYHRKRTAEAAWAGWLALATAVQGGMGLTALVMSQAQGGFSATTSALFTMGTATAAVTVVVAVAAIGVASWRGAG